MIEGGQSLTLSNNYKITKNGDDLLSLDLATVFRDDEDLIYQNKHDW